jgi:radical SAM superfamily enzyme YgiQ (UPF0313 family)
MTSVILIYPPVFYKKGQPEVLDVSYPPLGILYLAAVLEQNNISVKIIDVGAEKQTLKETLKIIKKEKPILVGISAMTPLLQGTVTLAKNIKKNNPKIKICLGGPHVSADPSFIKRIKYFDFGITGEGEYSFLEAYQNIINHQKNKKIIIGKTPLNLDKIPWPARHLIDIKPYHTTASLMATRGCPYNCYYCSRPCISNIVRYRSATDVVKEMDSLYDQCHGDYLFQDDSLTINRQFMVDFCHQLIKKKRLYRWAGYTRVDLVDEKLLKLMHQAGCYSLTFGIESGDENIRNNIVLKHFSNQRIIDIVNLCCKYHIEGNGFFIFGHPTETPTNLKQTMSFILKNDFKIIGVSIATPFPGSLLWQYALKEKIVDNKFIDKFALGKLGAGYSGVYPVYLPKTLDKDWVYLQRKNIFRRFYLRPKYIFDRIISDITSFSRFKTDIIEGFSVLIRGSSSRAPYKKKVK